MIPLVCFNLQEEGERREEKYFVNHDEGWPLEYLFVSSKGIGRVRWQGGKVVR